MPHQASVAETHLWRWLDWMMSLPNAHWTPIHTAKPEQKSWENTGLSLVTVDPIHVLTDWESIYQILLAILPLGLYISCHRPFFLVNHPLSVGATRVWQTVQVIDEPKTCLQHVSFRSEIAQTVSETTNKPQQPLLAGSTSSTSPWFFKYIPDAKTSAAAKMVHHGSSIKFPWFFGTCKSLEFAWYWCCRNVHKYT